MLGVGEPAEEGVGVLWAKEGGGLDGVLGGHGETVAVVAVGDGMAGCVRPWAWEDVVAEGAAGACDEGQGVHRGTG